MCTVQQPTGGNPIAVNKYIVYHRVNIFRWSALARGFGKIFPSVLKPAVGDPERCRSQWPRGLRRGCVAALLLTVLVLIPPGA
jgi:hypothetical protein